MEQIVSLYMEAVFQRHALQGAQTGGSCWINTTHNTCIIYCICMYVYTFSLCYFPKPMRMCGWNALSAGLSPGSKKRLEAQAKIGTHSRFVRPCQASALLTWYTSDLWYTSLICAKAKMMDLTGNGSITTPKRARKPLKNPNKKTSTQCTGQLASKRWKALRAAPPETKAKKQHTKLGETQATNTKTKPSYTWATQPAHTEQVSLGPLDLEPCLTKRWFTPLVQLALPWSYCQDGKCDLAKRDSQKTW